MTVLLHKTALATFPMATTVFHKIAGKIALKFLPLKKKTKNGCKSYHDGCIKIDVSLKIQTLTRDNLSKRQYFSLDTSTFGFLVFAQIGLDF